MTFDWVGALVTGMFIISIGTTTGTILSAIHEKWVVSVLLFIITVFIWGFMGGVLGV